MKNLNAETQAKKPSEGKASFRTVLSVFRSAGRQGDIVLCGGLASKILLAYSPGRFSDMEEKVGRSKDIDLYAFSGRPFGAQRYPHEWIQLCLADHETTVPAEIIYHPTPYFGFKPLQLDHISEFKYPPDISIPIVCPTFYIASILNSVPYRAEGLKRIQGLRRRYDIDLMMLDRLLLDSPVAMLFPGGQDEILHASHRGWNAATFIKNLHMRSLERLKSTLPFLHRMNPDEKTAYDAISLDAETCRLIGERYHEQFGNYPEMSTRMRVMGRQLFPTSFYDETRCSVIDGLIRTIKDENYVSNHSQLGRTSMERWDYASRMLWAFLQMIDASSDESGFVDTAKRWAATQKIPQPSPPREILRRPGIRRYFP